MPLKSSSKIALFSASRCSDVHRYLDGNTITILHRLDFKHPRTVIATKFPEKLTIGLWPDAQLVNDPIYGRALLWEFEANSEGLVLAHNWILKAVRGGTYDDLSGLSYRVEAQLRAMQDAGANMVIGKLVTVTNAGLQRLRDGTQIDASQSVQT